MVTSCTSRVVRQGSVVYHISVFLKQSFNQDPDNPSPLHNKDQNPIQSITSEISNFNVPLLDLWDEGEIVRN